MLPSLSRPICSTVMGMPQLWHARSVWYPSRALMDTLNRSEMAFRVSISGTVSPRSQRDTACRVTKSFSAISFWERPAFFRRSVNTSLNLMGTASFTRPAYHGGDGPSSNLRLPGLPDPSFRQAERAVGSERPPRAPFPARLLPAGGAPSLLRRSGQPPPAPLPYGLPPFCPAGARHFARRAKK